MMTTYKSTVLALAVMLAAAVPGACGGGRSPADQPAANAVGADKSGAANSEASGGGGTTLPCPGEKDVAAAVGGPVRSKPYRFGCFYETPDADTSVSIMSIAPGRADQVLEDMRSAARPYGADVSSVDIGERGHAWGSPAQSQGFAVAGSRAYMVEVTTGGGAGDKKAAVIQILKMMIG